MTPDRAAGDAPSDAPTFDQIVGVAPSKPTTPRGRAAAPTPVPIDVDFDTDDVTSPITGPPASEILPEPRSPLEAGPEHSVPAGAPRTAVQRLGDSAAANAALSARGAPTPLGGVPIVPGTPEPVELPFSASESAFVPTFAAVSSLRTPAGAPRLIGENEPISESPDRPSPLADAAIPEGDTPLYRPRVAAGTAAAGDPAITAGDGDGSAEAPHRPVGASGARRPGRALPLILIGLLTMGALVYVGFRLLSPAAIELPTQRVVVAASEQPRAVEPITPENPTPFLAALPTTAGDWALTGVVTNDPLADTALPARVAESHTLTYSDGTDEVVLDARQLYNADDANTALARAAGTATIEDMTVGGEVVGERAERTGGTNTRIMWTHDAVYFEAVGPTAAVVDFVAAFGL